jgi:hypothetical protein
LFGFIRERFDDPKRKMDVQAGSRTGWKKLLRVIKTVVFARLGA